MQNEEGHPSLNSDLTSNSDRNPYLNSDRSDSANSSLPCVMDHNILFQELVFAKHQLEPYSGFNGWEDEKLWDIIALRVTAAKSLIFRVLKTYKDIYSIDNTLRYIRPPLRNNVLLVFGSRQVLEDLDVNVVEKVLKEHGAVPSLPLQSSPRCVQNIIPSQSSSRYEDFRKQFGAGVPLAKQYGEDINSLNLNSDEVLVLLERCPPGCTIHLILTELAPHIRRKVLYKLMGKSFNNIAKSSNSSAPSKRKKPTPR